MISAEEARAIVRDSEDNRKKTMGVVSELIKHSASLAGREVCLEAVPDLSIHDSNNAISDASKNKTPLIEYVMKALHEKGFRASWGVVRRYVPRGLGSMGNEPETAVFAITVRW
jgi:hypothetical protein